MTMVTDRRLYAIWDSIKRRCTDPKNQRYATVGARGIKCIGWGSWADFAAWSHANGYVEGRTLRRLDKAGHYEPSNVRWMSKTEAERERRLKKEPEQMSNKDTNQFIEQCRAEGFTVQKTNGNHWRFTHPQMEGTVFHSSTPSDHRALDNLKSEIRRKMPKPIPANDEVSAMIAPEHQPLYAYWMSLPRDEMTTSWKSWRSFLDWSIAEDWREGSDLIRLDAGEKFSPDNAYWSDGSETPPQSPPEPVSPPAPAEPAKPAPPAPVAMPAQPARPMIAANDAAMRTVIELRAIRAEAEFAVCVDLLDSIGEREAVERRAFKAEAEAALCREFLGMWSPPVRIVEAPPAPAAAAAAEPERKKMPVPMPRRETGSPTRMTDEYLLSYLTDSWQTVATLALRVNATTVSVTKRYQKLAEEGRAAIVYGPMQFRLPQ